MIVTAEQAREDIRPSLVGLVNHHVGQGAPRMRAYDRVASLVGRSPAWIQRVIGRRPDTTVGLHDALNIRAAYDRLCARVEADNLRLDLELTTQEDARAARETTPGQRVEAPSQRRAPRRKDLSFRRLPPPTRPALVAV